MTIDPARALLFGFPRRCTPVLVVAAPSWDVLIVHAMQPYEANVPINSGRFVPWMAYSPPDRVSAADPSDYPARHPG